MRILLIVLLLSVLASAQMLQSVTNSKAASAAGWTKARAGAFNSANGTSSISTTISGGAPSQHHTMLLGLVMAGPTPTGITCKDSNNNSYSLATNSPAINTGQGLHIYGYYLLDTPANATAVITCSWTGSVFGELFVDDFVDGAGTQVFDTGVATADPVSCSGTSLATPTLTPAVAGELLYNTSAVVGLLSAPAAGGTLTGWTGANLDATNGPGTEYILSQGSAKAAAWTCGTSGDGAVGYTMAFKP